MAGLPVHQVLSLQLTPVRSVDRILPEPQAVPGAGGGDSCLFGDMIPIAVPWARIAVRLQAEYPRSSDR